MSCAIVAKLAVALFRNVFNFIVQLAEKAVLPRR